MTTDKTVRAIRQDYKRQPKTPYSTLAKKYSVSVPTVYRIANNLTHYDATYTPHHTREITDKYLAYKIKQVEQQINELQIEQQLLKEMI